MKVYLVGGAIRDQLLGLPVKEKDWVVVGSTPNEMRKNKFKQVGKDFPVFIHPKTGEEYALARTERKSGHGYTGFEFDTNPDVTLEEDLERRDLTINAIAQDEDGTLIDPFNGQEDIKNKKLRHVSDAFSEDPLRVLRLARFKADLFNFEIVPATLKKVKEIVISGELDYLTGERIWLELYKVNNEYLFAYNLRELGALEKVLGKTNQSLFKIKEKDRLEIPEANDISETEYYTRYGKERGEKNLSSLVGFMTLYCNWNIEDLNSFCDKLKVPNEYKEAATIQINCYDDFMHFKPENGVDNLISLIKRLDIRKEERLKNFLDELPPAPVIIEEQISFFEPLHKDFLIEAINKIKLFRLNKEDQKKSNKEIQKIVEDSHREILQDHIKKYLDSKKK